MDRVGEPIAEADLEVSWNGRTGSWPKSEVGLTERLGHPAIWNAYVEFLNLLAWGRSLDERPHNRFGGYDFGLIPRIADGSDLRREVERCVEEYWNR